MHAFIIEDEYLVAQGLADMLGEMGFVRFGFARSEDAAIMGAADGESIDLIVADAKLLPGDGVKAVEVICKDRKIPVIFVTGYVDELKDRLVGKRDQAVILGKPIKKEQLASAVREVLYRQSDAR